jgi:DNA end-binding protein Ku
MGKDDIVKGYEYEDDKYVVVEKNEFSNIKLKSTKVIEIEAFVELDEVHPSRYESLYYVGPREAAAGATYNLFVAALEKTGKAGVGKLVLRDKEDVVLLMAHKKRLVMYKLRYPEELKQIEDVPEVKVEEVADDQLKLAQTLIKSLEKGFEEIEFFDEYQHKMKELIDAKIEGKEVVIAAEPEAEPIMDITDALKASIENAKIARK